MTTRESGERRSLHVLGLHDGKRAATALRFDAAQPLTPSVWRGHVVVRAAKDRLEAYVLKRRKFRPRAANLEHTAGHYDPMAGVSRIFLPANRAEAFARVMSTYAHELTHHWIRERCPLFPAHRVNRHPANPGFWIVEGMATLVQEFDWDLDQQTWRTDSAGARSLDVVASAAPRQLLPWRVLFDVTDRSFDALSRKPTREVPMKWRLSWFNKLSDTHMFYSQAGAVCQYLFHAGPERRRQLIDYVRDYYTGAITPDASQGRHLKARFGLTPDALGQAVVAYAKARTADR